MPRPVLIFRTLTWTAFAVLMMQLGYAASVDAKTAFVACRV